MTEEGSSAPTERADEKPSAERVVIRDRRRVDRDAAGTDIAAPKTASPKTAGSETVTPGTAGSETAAPGTPDIEALAPETADPEAATTGAVVSGPEAQQDRPVPVDGGTDDAEKAAYDPPDKGPGSTDDGGESTTDGGDGGEPTEGGESSEDGTGSVKESQETGESEESTEGEMSSDDGTGSTNTGESAELAGAEEEAALGALGVELEALRAELDERIKDLQRVTAEYANYRKRVDRDRGLVAEQATGAVLSALLPMLDDLDRAREHGDLVGPFGSVAEQLTGALAKFGLAAFGEKGDPFDPNRHEAVAHLTSSDVSEPTCVDVLRRGYLLGDRLLRAALVAVADPE